MALEDYFKKNACTVIVQTLTDNDYGNKTVEDSATGATFDGLLVRRALGEEEIGSDRGEVSNRYNLFVPSNIDIAKDTKIEYTYRDGSKVSIRLTSNAILNDEASGQTGWKTYEAEIYTPAGGSV